MCYVHVVHNHGHNDVIIMIKIKMGLQRMILNPSNIHVAFNFFAITGNGSIFEFGSAA